MIEENSDLRLRSFRNTDQIEVRGLIIEGLRGHFGVIDESLNPDLDNIERNFLNKGHAFIVAEIGGQLVGAGGLMVIDNKIARMVRVSVANSHRRKGIGMTIVDRLVSIAREHGFERVLVETNHDWSDAISLYLRCGFVIYERDDISVHLQLRMQAD